MLRVPFPEKHNMSSYWVFHATLLALGSYKQMSQVHVNTTSFDIIKLIPCQMQLFSDAFSALEPRGLTELQLDDSEWVKRAVKSKETSVLQLGL